MKLNLLPKSVAKNVQSKTVFLAMAGLLLATLLGSFLYARKVSGDLQSYIAEANAKQPLAEQVVATSASADKIIADAKTVLTNSALVKEIDVANGKYPRLYNTLRLYLPRFLRVRSISAQSGGPTASVVTIQGYLKTFQQYSDVMIALLRFPGCSAVGRSGFGPVAPGDQGPFGYNPDAAARGPIPGYSAVTLTMAITSGPHANLQAPDARATLSGAVSGAGGTSQGAPGAPPPGVGPASSAGGGLLGGRKMGR
ncbi:MAG: hypothetical protein ACR2HJ_01230 [Fimbriimonadales bacterium]